MNRLRSRMDIAARYLKGTPQPAEALFISEQQKTLNRIWAGEPYIAATFYIPGEILSLFDVPVIYMERIAGFAAACGIGTRFGPAAYLPDCACTYQITFDRLISEGLLPCPAVFAASNFACDDAWLYCAAASQKYQVPLFFAEVPVCCAQSGEQLSDMAAVFRRFYLTVKNHFRQVRSQSEALEASACALSLKQEIDRLRIRCPGLIDSRECLNLFPLYNDLGRPFAVRVLSEFLRCANARLKTYRRPDGKRLMWAGLVPLFGGSILHRIEQRYSCRIVCEELFDFGPQAAGSGDFFYDIAFRLSACNYFSLKNRIRNILFYSDAIGLDGVISLVQKNCGFLSPLVMPLVSELVDYGIAVAELSGDVIDSRYFDEKKMWDKLDAFFEMEVFNR